MNYIYRFTMFYKQLIKITSTIKYYIYEINKNEIVFTSTVRFNPGQPKSLNDKIKIHIRFIYLKFISFTRMLGTTT